MRGPSRQYTINIELTSNSAGQGIRYGQVAESRAALMVIIIIIIIHLLHATGTLCQVTMSERCVILPKPQAPACHV